MDTRSYQETRGPIMKLLGFFSDSDVLPNWTSKRAAKAEREMLSREGYVVEPSYLWSLPAQIHEREAAKNRKWGKTLRMVRDNTQQLRRSR